MTIVISIAIVSVFLPGLPVRLSDPCASATKDLQVLGPCLVFTSSVFFQAQIIAVSRILPYLKESVDPCGTWRGWF